LLGVGPLGAETGGDFRLPFRGAVRIGGGEPGAAVSFADNLRGLGFVGAYPEGGLKISRATFVRHAQHALALALPGGARAEVAESSFIANGAAIALDGPLDGALTLAGTALTGNGLLRIDSGEGSFTAQLSALAGAAPALRFGAAFLDSDRRILDLDIAGRAKPDLLAVSPDSRLCRLDLSDKKQRAQFAGALDALKVRIAGRQLARLFAKSDGPLSGGELKAAQKALCR
jgi:hypothetical protein